MLFVRAQLCWLSFAQALRCCYCPQVDEPLKLSLSHPGVSRLCGLLHAPQLTVCKDLNPTVSHLGFPHTPVCRTLQGFSLSFLQPEAFFQPTSFFPLSS